MTRFRVRDDLLVDTPNAGSGARQTLRRGEVAITNNRILKRTIRGPWRDKVQIISEQYRPKTFALQGINTRVGRRLLFLLPSDGIGDCVGYFLFLQSVIETIAPARVAVACAGYAADVFSFAGNIKVFPLWISQEVFLEFDHIIDLLDALPLRTIADTPCDIEGALLDAASLSPCIGFGGLKRQIPARSPRIGIFPLSSTPMRSLPPALTVFLAKQLSEFGHIEIFLNEQQRQSQIYASALSPVPAGVALNKGFPNLQELLEAMAKIDYGIFSDSGPAHLTKILGLPGLAIHTSADATPLRGRFGNLQTWQSTYEGSFCAAPCGLSGFYVTSDARIGCMGSLACHRSDLTLRVTRMHDDDIIKRLLVEEAIPCVTRLVEEREDILSLILDQLGAGVSGNISVGSKQN